MKAQAKTLLVVAVSGGIDSVALLDILRRQTTSLIVAHVEHGIRDDTHEDEALVRRLAEAYGLPYVSTKLSLGARASEDLARQARYEWLETVRAEHGASAIATAHHQDDVLETIYLNIVRGTGWRGLCSLRQTPTRVRPLLSWSKQRIVEYAIERGLEWREDSTNDDLRYLRNRIRHGIMPRLTATHRQQLFGLYEKQVTLRDQLETECEKVTTDFTFKGGLRRYELIMVPDTVAYELLREWLGCSLEQSRLRDLLLFAKTAREGAKWSLDSERFITIKEQRLIV